jgi:hypothetical protein
MATFQQFIRAYGLDVTGGGFIAESFTDNITAHAGGGQASAFQLATEVNRITTVASPGDSVMLPGASQVGLSPSGPQSTGGLTLIIINHGANPVQVFGNGTDTIDDVASATGVTQMAGSVTIYTCTTPGAWYSFGPGSPGKTAPPATPRSTSASSGRSTSAGRIPADRPPSSPPATRPTAAGARRSLRQRLRSTPSGPGS